MRDVIIIRRMIYNSLSIRITQIRNRKCDFYTSAVFQGEKAD